MTKNRNCIDCGRALVDQVRGRPALRCGECKRGRKRIKERAKVRCVECSVEFDPPGHTGRAPERCEPCRQDRRAQVAREKSARWRSAKPDEIRKYDREYKAKQRSRPGYNDKRNADFLRLRYGLTVAEFDSLLDGQGGACAICAGEHRGTGKRFHVDHCHTSGQVRGLLCGNCNTAIGLLGDDPERAEKAAAYLRR